jgi:putative membrane-bound dehydrogenase-like protein
MMTFSRTLVRCSLAALLFISQALIAAPAKPLRALLITGGCCHDYATQKDLLKNGIEARAHVEVEVIYNPDKSTRARFEIYDHPDWANGYDVVIHNECSADVKDLAHVRNILNAHETVPAVNLHCAMHSYRIGTDDWFRFAGIQSTGHGPQEPIAIRYVDQAHPITRALADWTTTREELYNNVKIFETAHPLARGRQVIKQKDGTTREVEAVVAWVNEFGQSRVFSTTLAHNNATVADDRYLTLVTRGLLWACGKLDAGYLKEMAPAPLVRRVNLARGKPGAASSEQPGNFIRHAFDGSEGTRWCASGPRDNEWLQVDLGSPQKLTGCRIVWESDNVPYLHRIEGSADGNTWQALVDASGNDKSGASRHEFQVEGIRYVRVTFLGQKDRPSSWGSIREFEVFGEQTEIIDPKQAQQEADAAILKEVKVPAEFEVTLFARPPLVNYPVFVAAAPDGTLYVSSDGNGSLGRDPNRGRVLRLRDLDGDGRADEMKEFIKNIDTPRGLVWDHDRLYLLHPPHLSVFIDHDGDGIADEQKILVKNIAFTFKDRPGDHTSNGISLGVDGWLYAAIGDFGFMEAEGADGRKLQFRSGGVIRVRTDGTGLEVYARGTRNNLEVALSPLLDGFTRDNTNDGDGWDTRLHHFTGITEHGYPSLYKNFADEIIQPIAEYGGGSGCGAAWIEEPGIPLAWNNAPFTADWGRNWVYHHTLTPNGATYTASQKEFVGATRVTDLDVDAMSRVYVASWRGATFNWAGPDVGYLVRVTPKGYQPQPLPNFEKLSESELVKLLEVPSARRRLEAQRALLRRGVNPETARLLNGLASDASKPITSRVAALFALKQGLGSGSAGMLATLASDPGIAAWAIRALTDHEAQLAGVPVEPILRGLRSGDARTRKEAAISIARLGKLEHAPALTPLLGDADPIVCHTAVQALKQLKAAEACFAVVDSPGAGVAERKGALRVLQSLHDPEVVAGLIRRLESESDSDRRKGLLTALCRLHFTEGVWKGNFWGTRPDTSGPYYQTAEWSETRTIAAALRKALVQVSGEEAAHLISEFNRHKVSTDDMLETILAHAANDPAILPAAVGQFARAERIPSAALPLLASTATAENTQDLPRAQAVRALTKAEGPDAVNAILLALPKLEASKTSGTERERRQARDAFLNSSRNEQQLTTLAAEAAKLDPAFSQYADAALLRISDRKNASTEARHAATEALEKGWTNPDRRAQILRAVQWIEHRAYRDKVLIALDDSHAHVAAAARAAAAALKLDAAKDKPAQPAPSVPLIAQLKADDVLATVLKTRGDVKIGERIYSQQNCAACHTVRADEPLRGPYLGNIGAVYKRLELTEAILLPSKSIAQGFAANFFELEDGTEHEGFVIQEAADKVVIRNIAAQEITIPVKEIVRREKLERSLMPEGLAANLTVQELASLIDYLEALANE